MDKRSDLTDETKAWLEAREYSADQLALARVILEEIRTGRDVSDAVRRHPQPDGSGHLAKHILVAEYQHLVESGEWPQQPNLLQLIRMKPIRTLSGVTTVTVLTKPYPCPGQCIFCPTEDQMPKSYLADEPGARRALQNQYDPFAQVTSRLQALQAVGHPTDKIELLILGGTFDAYRKDYQQWFIRRCYEALNQAVIPSLPGADGFIPEVTAENAPPVEPASIDGSAFQEETQKLRQQHKINESGVHRNVGLVIETRPDQITFPELAWIRSMGVTKLQMGAQSLDDRILLLNHRGHTVEETLKAMLRLRAAGFKIVLHWMPNLLGATPQSDREDFSRLWKLTGDTGGLCPDEIKIYPTQLLKSAELYTYWQRGEYQPYTEEELIGLLADLKATIPRYCRVNRVIRDIPSNNVVEGNRRTSLRQDALEEMHRRGTACQCIRCREVRGEKIRLDELKLDDLVYQPAVLSGEPSSIEHFLSFITPDDKIAGYLRLSIPSGSLSQRDRSIPELAGTAIIREVHVYGQSLQVGVEQAGAAQHIGLGRLLIETAGKITRQAGFEKMAVISAVGTRGYYRFRGFEDGSLYQIKSV
jgi:elongator complex protein 3